MRGRSATRPRSRSTFERLALLQALAVVALVPPFVAGAFPDAERRKTLAFLLGSPLSSAEIVTAVLFARLVPLASILLISLPIVCLLSLFGGVDANLVVVAYGGAASTAFFLGALAVLISVHVPRPREAVVVATLAEVVLIVVPWLLGLPFPRLRAFRPWLAPVTDWVAPASPLALLTPATILSWSRIGPRALATPFERMVVFQVCYGSVLLAVAAWRLRPAFRARADAPRRRGSMLRVLFRQRVRRTCGDDPMLWKELRAPDDDRASRLIATFSLVLFALLLAYIATPSLSNYQVALDEFFLHGYDAGPSGLLAHGRSGFNENLCSLAALASVPYFLVLAISAAGGISGERERETWTGLIATSLDTWEIVRAKMAGARRAGAAPLPLIVAPWLIGLALGATHPVGFVAACVGLGIFSWFTVALGTFVSLHSRSSSQAFSRVVGIMLALQLGPLLLAGPFAPAQAVLFLSGNMPELLYRLPVSSFHFGQMRYVAGITLRDLGSFREPSGPLFFLVVALPLVYLEAYALAGWLIVRRTLRDFDRVAGRPRRSRRPPRG